MTSSLPLLRTQAAMNGIEWNTAGCLFCVDGTVYPGAPTDQIPPGGGFSSDIAYGLMAQADGLWNHVFVGYPAAVTPMWPSVQIGRANLIAAIIVYANAYFAAHGTYAGLWIVLSGYSQGALVTDQVWVLDILPEGGVLHYLLDHILRIYNFGDPFRSPGIANGNTLAGLPLPSKLDGVVTGGIGGPQCLTAAQTPALLMSFANNGDLYAACPVGADPWKNEAAAGKVGTSIYNVIMKATIWNLLSIAKDLATPVGMIEEIFNGAKFAAEGLNAPHWHYEAGLAAAVSEMIWLGNGILAGTAVS